MKPSFLVTFSLALAIAVSGCASTPAPATPEPQAPATAAPTTAAAPSATPVPATATSVPPSPTPAPPTAVPTVPPTPTTAAGPTNTPAPQAAANGPAVSQSDMLQVATAMAAAKSYRITVTTAGTANTATGTFVIEVVKPDRMHMKSTNSGQTFETISIGQDTYLNVNGKWTKSPAKAPVASTLLSSDPQKFFGDTSNVQKNGTLTKGATTAVEGTPCQEWNWTPTATAPTGSTSFVICVGLKDSLPISMKSSDGKFEGKYTDWNAPISIEAPI